MADNRKNRFGWLITLLVSLLVLEGEAQNRYHVALDGNDAEDGLSWATALQTIPAAMDKATDGDTVMLSNGVFSITAQIELTNNVTITSTNGAAYTTVDAGNVNGRRVFYMTAAGAVIERLTITRGRVNNGAGVFMTDGMLQNCIVSNNVANQAAGGVWIDGGVLRNSVIRDNSSGWSGGGIRLVSGTVENCLITGNRGAVHPVGTGGGGVYQTAGTLQFSTIVGNYSRNTGGGVFAAGGTIRNSIVSGNRLSDSGAPLNLVYTGATVTYSCAPELSAGTGNITADPEFTDAAAGNYRLRPGSPCIDGGVEVAGVNDDFDGAARSTDGTGNGMAVPDMGAFEAEAANSGALRFAVIATVADASDSLNAELKAYVHGAETNGLYFQWDFNNDGMIDDEGGSEKQTVNHLYTPGLYSVNLIVSNDQGEVAIDLREQYIRVRTTPTYVAASGTPAAPFDSWATAATSIEDAMAMTSPGGEVLVSNGTYYVTSQINLDSAVTVRAANGPDVTTVERQGAGLTRIFGISHADAVLDGITVNRGSAPTYVDFGGGIYMSAGTVRNSIITNNTAVFGGGVFMTGGMVTNSVLIGNPTKGGGGSSGRGGGASVNGGVIVDSLIRLNTSVRAGAGVRMTGGVILRSRIENNTSGHGGGGVAMEGGGRLENCLITGNSSGSWLGGGGGVFMNNAACQIVHCTIVGNETAGTGGGIHRIGGTVTNSIVYYNTRSGGVSDDVVTGGNESLFRHTCASDLTHDPSGTGNISSPPVFNGQSAGDFSLAPASPCIDAGINLADVTTDIDGNMRPEDGTGDGQAIADMGCYEAPDPAQGPLQIDFVADVLNGNYPLSVVFTALPMGSVTDNLYLEWDFNQNGTVDESGYGLKTVTNVYTQPGLYGVALKAVNALSEESTAAKSDYIRVYAATTYVAVGGTATNPYTNWMTAASNIQDAVDAVMDGGLVLIGEGIHVVDNAVNLTRGLTVRGDTGRTNTFVQRNPSFVTRIFNVGHSNAVVEGLTVRNGSGPAGHDTGGGIYLTAGTIRDCIVSNNTANTGGGITMTGGAVSNSLIINNPTKSGGGGIGQGGGIFMTGGEVSWSMITGNSSTRQGAGVRVAGADAVLRNSIVAYNTDAWGGSVNLSADGIVENCLIYGNAGGSHLGGGGIYVSAAGARIRNSTVIGNHTTGDGGGVRWVSGALWNMIVIDNAADGVGQDIDQTTGFGYSLSPDLIHDPAGTGNITNAPKFIENGTGFGLSHTPGDYQLDHGSPAIDAGVNMDWMLEALDLDGNPRIVKGLYPPGPAYVDIGAYEYIPIPRGTLFKIK